MRFTVIVMLIAFSFISSDVLAQDAIKSTTAKKESVHPKTDNSQPYYMYKGIKDINEAKKAWATDNPEAYSKLNETKLVKASSFKESSQGHSGEFDKITPASQKVKIGDSKAVSLKSLDIKSKDNNEKVVLNKTVGAPVPAKLPNAERRLPANYDDSKTNETSKE